jgi:polyisoprenoid-binding protein YceI
MAELDCYKLIKQAAILIEAIINFKSAKMKKSIFPVFAAVIILISAFTFFQSIDWKIGDKYSVKFDGGDPKGEFSGLKGTIQFDANNLAASKFDCTIDVATINTGNGMQNTHAKSEKWLDAAKYPVIRFTSKSIAKTATGYEATGTLDFHGVQKEIKLPFTFVNNVFEGAFELNRMDYNINKDEPKHGGSDFKIMLSVPVTK